MNVNFIYSKYVNISLISISPNLKINIFTAKLVYKLIVLVDYVDYVMIVGFAMNRIDRTCVIGVVGTVIKSNTLNTLLLLMNLKYFQE